MTKNSKLYYALMTGLISFLLAVVLVILLFDIGLN